MGIYIHIPFCGSICSYCHFATTAEHGPDLRARFVRGVIRELALRKEHCAILATPRRKLETCYLGGGTPSALEPELMSALLEEVLPGFEKADGFELTAEANPESMTAELAAAWRNAGIERVSLGVQSLDPHALIMLGRQCDPAQARSALAMTCKTFPRVSADWIIGPGLKREKLLAELSEAVDMGVGHFSVYILELHPDTKLEQRVRRGQVKLLPDSETEALYLAVVEHLASMGVHQYEVSNFCRPGLESRHNQNYWRHRPWLGLGPGAHGYWGRRRYANHDDVHAWLAAVESGELPECSVDEIDGASMRLERLILRLRTKAGLPVQMLPEGALDLERGAAEGLWRVEKGRLGLTTKGFLRIDTIEERLARLTL
ncbi:MAG: putative oxygen-independent coproporphyrinogen III oxidase [Candidatus Krumholzibacteriia bacterium]|jgi:putative oxygen-independent coproporphyrinogen III oxidase